MTKSPNVTYNEYPFGHASFLIAKDMSYLNDVLAVLETYNPEMKKIDMEKIIDAWEKKIILYYHKWRKSLETYWLFVVSSFY